MHRQNLPLMMYGIDDLREKKFVRKQPEQAKEESEQQNRLIRQKVIFDALWCASGHQGKEKGSEDILKLSNEAQAQFAAHVFTDIYSEPTLVLLEAQGWRNRDVLPQFANGRAVMKDQVDLTHVKTFERLYKHKDLPHLRIIRVRPHGSGETPQYQHTAKSLGLGVSSGRRNCAKMGLASVLRNQHRRGMKTSQDTVF